MASASQRALLPGDEGDPGDHPTRQAPIKALVAAAVGLCVAAAGLAGAVVMGPGPRALTNSKPTATRVRDPLTVFYHVFQANVSGGEELSASIVREQLSMAKSSATFGTVRKFNYVFVGPSNSSVPTLFNCSTCHQLEHRPAGDEVITLQHIFEHCAQNPTGRVLYMHNKGSFHNSPRNDILRRFLTKGIWSDACQNMPLACSACGSRFSPLPHPHFPGNMWVAKCAYVSRLIPPLKMEAAMERVSNMMLAAIDGSGRDEDGMRDLLINHPAYTGRDRYSSEHWVTSHPSVVPCDVYNRTDYVWGYNFPEEWYGPGGSEDWTPTLGVFPRSGMPLSEFCHRTGELDLNMLETLATFTWQHLYPESSLQPSLLSGYYNESVSRNCEVGAT